MTIILLAYLYAILPGINEFLGFLSFVPLVTAILIPFLGGLAGVLDDEALLGVWKRWVPKAALLTVITMGINVIVPDREGFKYIVGAYVAVEVGTSVSEIEGIERLPKSMVDMVDSFLKTMTMEFEKQAVDKAKEVTDNSSSE